MNEIKNIIDSFTENNIIYIIMCLLLAYLGVKVAKKIIKFIVGIVFTAYSILKFAISFNLINLSTFIK